MSKYVVEVDGIGVEAGNLQEVANLLGVKRVQTKDIEDGGKYEDVVSLTSELEDEDTEVLTNEEDTVALTNTEDSTEESSDDVEEEEYVADPDDPTAEEVAEEDSGESIEESTEEDTPVSETKEEVEEDVEDIEYPEKGTFSTDKELKKFYKKLTDEQLDEWLELEGLEYKANDNPSINRMRKCMAILYYHFPKQPSKSKKKSKYSQYSTEELVQMAMDNDVEVRDDKGDERILRMYTIMALRDAGIIS